MMENIPWLETYLDQGFVILILDEPNVSLRRILSVWEKNLTRNEEVLVLSVLPNPMELYKCYYRRITADEEALLLSRYFTYEFSDRFRVFSRQHTCGSFFNLVDTGYVTMDEALVAWLRG